MAGPWEQYQSATKQTGPWDAYVAKKGDDAIDKGAKNFANDSGPGMRFVEGAGKAVHDVAQGLGQSLGLSNRADVAESRRLDAPLMNTGAAANIGNVAGNLGMMAPAMLAGGLTVPAAAAVGAGMGLIAPSESTGETLMNVGLGAAGGAGGQKVSNMMANAATNRLASVAAQNAVNAPKLTVARDASALGYVIPPEDLNANMLTKALSGMSGKIKTAQEASARNQPVTNDLAKAAVGLKKTDQLSISELNNIRSKAGQAYDSVASAGTIQPTAAYTAKLDAITAPYLKAAQGFPNAKPSPIIAEIESLKSPSFDAGSAVEKIKTLRSDADLAYRQGDKNLGKALKDGAGALEDAIETHLTAIGAPADTIKNFRDARQLIAKTSTIQKALNDTTGDVAAPVLGKMLEKGKPLSGELADIGRFNAAFGPASQALKQTPKATSPLDWAAGAISSSGTGSVLPMAMVGARPLARSTLLSPTAQKAALSDVKPSASTALLKNKLAQLLAAPAGIEAGLVGAELAR